jgi:hypothetical protein
MAGRGARGARVWQASRWILVASLAACGGAGGGAGFSGSDSGAEGATGPADSGARDVMIMLNNDTGVDDGSVNQSEAGDGSDGCSEAAMLVYVTGSGAELWSFYPPTLKFTDIGPLSCLDSPTHMTVDRQGSAWVVSDGKIYKASTKDASCALVSNWTPSIEFDDFALTFIGVSHTVVDDTLYMMGSSKLGKFDIATGAVTTIGPAPVPDALGDMTSNGDGTLYFLWDTEMATLFNVNPANASVISHSPIGQAGGGDQALAFWGGSFYAFENDIIYQYDPKKKTSKSLGMAPLSITGAGQSTCVPKVPPPPPK